MVALEGKGGSVALIGAIGMALQEVGAIAKFLVWVPNS
jgi:hypothetical protein